MVKTCYYCGEGIVDDDIPEAVRANMAIPHAPEPTQDLHMSCALRSAIGSVGHLLGLCRCPGCPGIMDDPPGLTRHEAARYAQRVFVAMQDPGWQAEAAINEALRVVALERGDG